ncbi:hypothetical protein HOLleu_37084 [Holothuria leucospilota]|uniref:Uncharacterized protein n=1 Tax=Holothuria leucospilota TaxID=206669 RepID=A0A9Q0YKJ3_HOLLE|nr:hypothetical protein HOLleu_37084 [Holothuria leucospilota]
MVRRLTLLFLAEVKGHLGSLGAIWRLSEVILRSSCGLIGNLVDEVNILNVNNFKGHVAVTRVTGILHIYRPLHLKIEGKYISALLRAAMASCFLSFY